MWPRLDYWLQIVLHCLNATAYLASSIILSGPFQWSAYQVLQTPRLLLKDQRCRKSVCSEEHSPSFSIELRTCVMCFSEPWPWLLPGSNPRQDLSFEGSHCFSSGSPAWFTACCKQQTSPIKTSPSDRARGEAEPKPCAGLFCSRSGEDLTRLGCGASHWEQHDGIT